MKNKIDNFINCNALGIALVAIFSTLMLISGLSLNLIAAVGNF